MFDFVLLEIELFGGGVAQDLLIMPVTCHAGVLVVVPASLLIIQLLANVPGDNPRWKLEPCSEDLVLVLACTWPDCCGHLRIKLKNGESSIYPPHSVALLFQQFSRYNISIFSNKMLQKMTIKNHTYTLLGKEDFFFQILIKIMELELACHEMNSVRMKLTTHRESCNKSFRSSPFLFLIF